MPINPDFSIREFHAWVLTKPADEAYEVVFTNTCALGQFGTATKQTYLHVCYDPERELGQPGLNEALGFDDADGERTFGALAERLEKLIPAKPKSEWLEAETYIEHDSLGVSAAPTACSSFGSSQSSLSCRSALRPTDAVL